MTMNQMTHLKGKVYLLPNEVSSITLLHQVGIVYQLLCRFELNSERFLVLFEFRMDLAGNH